MLIRKYAANQNNTKFKIHKGSRDGLHKVDPRISSMLELSKLGVTVQLEYFVKNVCFIEVLYSGILLRPHHLQK